MPNATSSSGLQVAMADGSVSTLAPGLSPTTFWALVTPAGDEVLGNDWQVAMPHKRVIPVAPI